MCEQQWLRLACAYAQSYQSHCEPLKYYMTDKLLTKHHLEFLSLKQAAQARLKLHLLKYHIVGNHMSQLIYILLEALIVFLNPQLETLTNVLSNKNHHNMR